MQIFRCSKGLNWPQQNLSRFQVSASFPFKGGSAEITVSGKETLTSGGEVIVQCPAGEAQK